MLSKILIIFEFKKLIYFQEVLDKACISKTIEKLMGTKFSDSKLEYYIEEKMKIQQTTYMIQGQTSGV